MDTTETTETTLTHQAGVVAGYAAAIALAGVAVLKTTRFVKGKLVARKAHKPETN